jgi:hypothetical protein
MRLTLSLLGFELDVTLGRETEPADDDVWVDCGTTVSTPVGFVRPEIPWDADCPVHQFDPGDGDEDT